MRIFKINEHLSVIADSASTRNGFKHTAKLLVDGRDVGVETKINYLNRTWESYEYESVLNKLKEKASVPYQMYSLTPKDKEQFGKMIKNRGKESKAEVESQFKATAMVAKLGELFGKDQKEKNDWKARMLKAGLPELDIPEDWDTLSEDEKEARLNKVIELASGQEKKEEKAEHDYSKENERLHKKMYDEMLEEEEGEGQRKPKYLLRHSKKAQMPMTMTHMGKLGSLGSGWHKEPVSHSYATKYGKAPKSVRGR